MAHTFQINYVKYRLEFLNKLKCQVNDVAASYINEVINDGKSWMKNRGKQETFSKIKQKMDKAVDFLDQKCQEISDQLEMRSPAESESQESQTLPNSDSWIEPSPEVTATAQKTFTATFKNIQKQLNDLFKADEIKEKRLKEHTDKIAEKEAEIQKQESKLQSLEKHIKKLSKKQNKLEEESLLNNNACDELNGQIQDMSEDTESHISALYARLAETDSSVQDLVNRAGSQEQAIQSLCTKVDTNMEAFKRVLTVEEKNAKMMRQFTDRMQETETRVREELEKVGGQFQETETSFRNVCQLLTKRLQPLEQLRDVFSQKAKARDDNLRQLQHIVKIVAIMSPKLAQLENKFRTQAVGFTAYKLGSITTGQVVTSYINSNYYNSGHFDFQTGMFIVPVAGVYVINLSVSKYLKKVDCFQIQVKYKNESSHSGNESSHILFCVNVSNVKHAVSSDLFLAQLKAGNKVYLEMHNNNCDVDNILLRFSCFMIR